MNGRIAASLAVIVCLGTLFGCSSDKKPLTPDQIDTSMIGQAVKVKGRTVTVEGVLFQAGIELVVVHGNYSTSNTSVTSNKSG